MDHTTIASMVRAVERKDGATAAHTWRVALYAQAMAEVAGLGQPLVQRIMHGAVLHDIGKIDLPASILQKPGALTSEEFEVVKTHTTLGYERLRLMGEDDPLVLDMVRSHHERLDGSGYPDGLRGDDIPLAAQFFAVIDSFDAMTSWRSYREAASLDGARDAIDTLKSEAGARYGIRPVHMFARLFETGRIDWILTHFNDPDSIGSIDPAPSVRDVEAIARQLQPGPR